MTLRKRYALVQTTKRSTAQKIIRIKREHAAERRRWHTERRLLEASLEDAKRQLANLSDTIGKSFTPKQVSRLSSGRREPWAEEDIVRALALRCISTKSYEYLRDKLHFPLPCLQTLRNWTNAYKTQPGLQALSLKAMSSVRDTLSEQERLVVLSFDEMAVDDRVTYDSTEDRVYGPCKQVQVLMVRSLCARWKQPVYFDFDAEMTRSTLFAAIAAVEEVGYRVVATVCDLSATNRRLLWTSEVEGGLGIDPDDAWFQNPCDPTR